MERLLTVSDAELVLETSGERAPQFLEMGPQVGNPVVDFKLLSLEKRAQGGHQERGADPGRRPGRPNPARWGRLRRARRSRAVRRDHPLCAFNSKPPNANAMLPVSLYYPHNGSQVSSSQWCG